MKQMGDGNGKFLSAWGGISSLQFVMCNWLPMYSRFLIDWDAWDRGCLRQNRTSNNWDSRKLRLHCTCYYRNQMKIHTSHSAAFSVRYSTLSQFHIIYLISHTTWALWVRCRHGYVSITMEKNQQLCTRESQMKTLKKILNIIYCAEVVQSCITFQNDLPHAQCKSSSAYKVHKFL